MDIGDPEQRVADLERQIAERHGNAAPPPARSGRAAGLRRFEASAPFWGSKWNGKRAMWIGYGGIALFAVPMWILSYQAESHSRIYDVVSVAARPLLYLLAIFVMGGMAYSYWRRQHKKIYIDVTGDGLMVSGRPGEVFSFRDAQLGPWSFWQSMGSVLHLRCGPNSFALGGRDHRLNAGFQAPPAKDVDAWLWAAEFDELLAMAGLRGEFDAHALASGQPEVPSQSRGQSTRCALFPNPEMVSLQPFWAPWRVTRMANSFLSPAQPSLAIDVGPEEIRVVDPTTNAVQATAWLAQATAVPEFYLLLRPFIFMWPYKFYPYAYLKNLQWTSPVLVVRIPGAEPISITCRDDSGKDYLMVLTDTVINRFSWHNKVPMRINRPAEWSVSAADWLFLVETFGLTQQLEDTTNHGRR